MVSANRYPKRERHTGALTGRDVTSSALVQLGTSSLCCGGMRPAALNAPGEFLFALLMAASPMIGAIWVTPDITKWTVFGVGCAMVVGVIAAALRPVPSPGSTE